MGWDRGERVDLAAFAGGVKRVQGWRHGHESAADLLDVTVGVLPDSRWFAARTRMGARAYATEGQAREAAVNLMADRQGWREVPVEFDARQNPTSPGWRRSGGSWFLEEPGQSG